MQRHGELDNEDGARCSRGILLAVLALALALRLGWGLTRSADPADLARLPDQVEYVSLARSLLNTGRLAFVDPRFNSIAYAFRMPGYPALVAACGAKPTVVRAVQAVLDASTVLATIWLARRWLGPRPSYVAGLLVALDPLFVYFSGLVLSETSFACLLTWGIACLAHGDSLWTTARNRWRRGLWWLGVLLLLASIYIRPAAIVLPVALVATAGLVEVRSPAFLPARRRWPVLTIVALLTVASLVPWAVRNRAILDHWVWTTTNDSFTLYDGWQPRATGASDLSVIDEVPVLANLGEVQRSDYLRQLAIDAAKADPMRIVRLVPARLARLWSPVPLSAEYGSNRLYVIGAALHAVPLMLLAIAGVFASHAIGPRGKLFLLTAAIVTSVIFGLTVGSLRYRMPVHPTLAVLAASALAGLRPMRDTHDGD